MRGGSTGIGRCLVAGVIVVAAVSGCGRSISGTPVAAGDGDVSAPSSALREISGEWVGTYTCAQGETGLTLTVDADGGTDFAFYALPANVAARSGRFEMRATAEGARVEFRQVRWLVQPSAYQMVDLVATERTAVTMRGNVIGAGCTTFQISRDQT